MIYTVTFNPSLDYIVEVEEFRTGRTNRTSSELLLPGGKGVNVSIVLKNLGLDSTALGFFAGFVGEEIVRRLQELGISTDFIRVAEGNSRINIKLRSIDGTEINGAGPKIGADQIAVLMEKLGGLAEGDVLFLAGSVPASMPEGIYRDILGMLEGRHVLTVVDAAGKLLAEALPYRPFLIKPNQQELEELFGVALPDRESVVFYAERLQRQGARNVLVSLAEEGAVLVSEDRRIRQKAAPAGKLINSVGSGDAMAAGFMAGWLERQDYEHAFCMGIAAGSASAFSEYLCTKDQTEALYAQLAGERAGKEEL